MKRPNYLWIYPIIPFALSWIFDFPQILSIPLKADYGITEDKILMLYSIYSLPNMIFVFIGGILLNKFGMRIFLLCILLVFFGNCIFCLGILMNYYWLMMTGRFLVGLGGETGITATFWSMNNFIEEKYYRKMTGLIYIVCTISGMGNIYSTPRIWLATKSFFWPIILSSIAQIITLIAFSLFYLGNEHIKRPVYKRLTDIIDLPDNIDELFDVDNEDNKSDKQILSNQSLSNSNQEFPDGTKKKNRKFR